MAHNTFKCNYLTPLYFKGLICNVHRVFYCRLAYVYIRVYRKAMTGEGVFMFDTNDPEAIFEQVQRALRSLSRNKPDSVSVVKSFLAS